MNLSRRQFSKSIFAGTLATGLSSLSGFSGLFTQSVKPPQPTDETVYSLVLSTVRLFQFRRAPQSAFTCH